MAESSCNVTVFDAIADDDRLAAPARRRFELRGGGRVEIQAGHGKALAIACTADAGEIKVVTLSPRAEISGNR